MEWSEPDGNHAVEPEIAASATSPIAPIVPAIRPIAQVQGRKAGQGIGTAAGDRLGNIAQIDRHAGGPHHRIRVVQKNQGRV